MAFRGYATKYSLIADRAGPLCCSCKIDGIRVGPRELQGAIVDPAQALVLVQVLGIIVKSVEESY